MVFRAVKLVCSRAHLDMYSIDTIVWSVVTFNEGLKQLDFYIVSTVMGIQ